MDSMSDLIKKLGIFAMIVSGGFAALFLIILFFSWLMPNSLTNKQIVEETKYCESNGMKASPMYNGFTLDVIKIVCEQKEDK